MAMRGGRPDKVWGLRSRVRVASVAQRFALFAGAVYVGIGVVGFFFTGFNNFTEYSGESLIWIFGITPFHNVVHIGVGGVWLLAAFLLTPPAAEGVNFAIGGFYVLAGVLGTLGYLNILLGVGSGLFSPDNPLHFITGIVALLFAGLFHQASSSGEADDRELAAR